MHSYGCQKTNSRAILRDCSSNRLFVGLGGSFGVCSCLGGSWKQSQRCSCCGFASIQVRTTRIEQGTEAASMDRGARVPVSLVTGEQTFWLRHNCRGRRSGPVLATTPSDTPPFMRLTASDIFSVYRPTLCSVRVYLREQRIPEAEEGVFEKILQTLGERHEQSHLATLGAYEDWSAVWQDQCVQKTLEAVRNRVPVIYQGELSCDTILGSSHVSIAGRPDFLILDGEAYLIRDSKLSRKVDDKHHVEIALQLQLYGWLFEQTVGKPAKRLQVHAGGGNIIEVPYDGGTAALTELAHILKLKCLGAEPYEPLGWTKCGGGCGYYERCW